MKSISFCSGEICCWLASNKLPHEAERKSSDRQDLSDDQEHSGADRTFLENIDVLSPPVRTHPWGKLNVTFELLPHKCTRSTIQNVS